MKKLGKLGLKLPKDPYGSGKRAAELPYSNWGPAPMKSPLKSNFDAAKVYATPRKTHPEKAKQVPDLSKGFMANKSKVPGYAVVKKSDKWKA